VGSGITVGFPASELIEDLLEFTGSRNDYAHAEDVEVGGSSAFESSFGIFSGLLCGYS
jgi:hypothetical protein